MFEKNNFTNEIYASYLMSTLKYFQQVNVGTTFWVMKRKRNTSEKSISQQIRKEERK